MLGGSRNHHGNPAVRGGMRTLAREIIRVAGRGGCAPWRDSNGVCVDHVTEQSCPGQSARINTEACRSCTRSAQKPIGARMPDGSQPDRGAIVRAIGLMNAKEHGVRFGPSEITALDLELIGAVEWARSQQDAEDRENDAIKKRMAEARRQSAREFGAR